MKELNKLYCDTSRVSIREISSAVAKEIIVKVIDSIVPLLDSNYTLWGSAIMVKPVWAVIIPAIVANGKTLVCKMDINITVSEFIN